jgi:hypothetical protein
VNYKIGVLTVGVVLCRLRRNLLVMYGSNSHKMCLYDEKALKRSDCRKGVQKSGLMIKELKIL